MATDLKSDLLEEIALEGLDGITISTLWQRLEVRPGFSLPLDEHSKAYLWRCVLGLQELEYYKLSKPRPQFVLFNRFHYIEPETRHFLEPEELPEDIYPVNVITDQPVKGSCVEYKTRKDLTQKILNDKPSLDEVIQGYGNSLVIVASPGDRMRTLVGPHNDPNLQLTDLSYCILERIGRSRMCGEVAAGRLSLSLFVDSSKMLFYQMKKLRALTIVKKQRMCAIRKPSNVKVTLSLFHLTRFFTPVINKTQTELIALARHLSNKPEQMDIVLKTKQVLKLYDKNFKKVAQTCTSAGERFFEFIDIPWREIHPNATPKDYLLKSGRAEKTIRHIRFLKTMAEVKRRVDFDDSSDDEDDDSKVDDNVPKVEFRRELDQPYVYQVLSIIRGSGARGLSMAELLKVLRTTKLGVRRVCNFLHRLSYVTTVLMNKGRQKEVMYVAVENIEDNKIRKRVQAESEKYGDISVEEFKLAPKKPRIQRLAAAQAKDVPQYTLTDELPTEQKIVAIKEELDKLEDGTIMATRPPSQDKIECIRVLTEDGTFVKVKIEEMTMMGPEYMKTDKTIGIKRFGKMITDVHIRRANWIIEVVNAVKVVENFKLIRLLRNREKEMNLTYMMDQKSLKRLVIALVQEGKIRCFYAWITMGTRQREFHYLCERSIGECDAELTRAIEQAKLRYFSVTKEDLKKKAKLISSPPKPPDKHDPNKEPGVPQTAKDSIQKHLEYRQRLLKKAACNMKYDRKAGHRYGLLPKMLRIQAAHQLLWHVAYDMHGKNIVSKDKNAEATVTGTTGDDKTTTKRKAKTERSETAQAPGKKPKLDNSAVGVQETDVEEKHQDIDTTKPERIGKGKEGTWKVKVGTEAEVSKDAIPFFKGTEQHSQLDLSKEAVKSGQVEERGENTDVRVLMEEEKVFVLDPVGTKDEFWPQREPHVYYDEMTWRRYMPPAPMHAGFPKGWCLISDILLNLPVSLFCQLVNVCYDIPGLMEILNHSEKRLYPVMKLPFTIAQQLLHSKKYIISFFDLCSYLCEMGLLSFGQEVLKDKDQTFVYIHHNLSLLDTRESLRGYNKTRCPEGMQFPLKTYTLTKLTDVNNFWEEMQIIALGSNLGYKSMLHADVEDTVSHCERTLKEVAKSHTPSTIVDDWMIPGDRRGACGLDSGLFAHTTKNWMFTSMSMTSINCKPYSKLKSYANDEIESERKIITKHKIKGKPRLHLSDNADKPVVIKKVMREGVKGNRGGRGIRKTHRIIHRTEGKLKQKRTIKIATAAKVVKKKKPFEKGDDKDRAIYAKRRKQRVIWTAKEDSVLLMCWLACLLMDRNRRVSIVNYRVMRDYIQDNVGEVSYDKTSIACARRLKFVLKNPQTEANLLLFYREANQDTYIVREFVQRVFINTDKDIVTKFRALTDLLLEKFQSLNLQKSCLPESLAELHQYSQDSMCKLHNFKVFSDITCKEDICHDVLRNILHSAVLLQDKQGRTHEMFKLLTQYPDTLLSRVIKELRTDGLFVIQKKQYAKVALSQLQSGLGLRNFKVSQRYMYNYKHRNLSTLFEESADFLDHLCDRYLRYDGDHQCDTLDFQPTGGQAAIIIPLVLQKRLDINLTIPQELVIVDMEGFYNFPWGRGKSAVQATTKADKSLIELKKHRLALGKDTPKSVAPTAAAADITIELVGEDLEEGDEEDLHVSTDKDTDVHKRVEKFSAKSTDRKMEKAIAKSTEGETDKAIVKSTDDETDKAIAKSTEDEMVKASAKSTDGEIETGEMEIKGKSQDTKIEFETVVEKNGEEVTITIKQKAEEKEMPCKTGFALVGKTIEEIKRNLSCEAGKSSEDPRDQSLEYTCTRNGTSTFIVPQQEADTGVVPEGASGIASRTLLSLRRAEDVSFEDIRVFNAQDNFVVNSCKIKVKLRDTDKDTGVVGETAVRQFCGSVDDLVAFPEAGDEVRKTLEEKRQFVEELRLGKRKLQGIWEDLQRLLPFEMDMDQVWSALQEAGVCGEDLTWHRLVYSHIESQGVLGVRAIELQRHFQSAVPWREIVTVLQKYAAVQPGTRSGL